MSVISLLAVVSPQISLNDYNKLYLDNIKVVNIEKLDETVNSIHIFDNYYLQQEYTTIYKSPITDIFIVNSDMIWYFQNNYKYLSMNIDSRFSIIFTRDSENNTPIKKIYSIDKKIDDETYISYDIKLNRHKFYSFDQNSRSNKEENDEIYDISYYIDFVYSDMLMSIAYKEVDNISNMLFDYSDSILSENKLKNRPDSPMYISFTYPYNNQRMFCHCLFYYVRISEKENSTYLKYISQLKFLNLNGFYIKKCIYITSIYPYKKGFYQVLDYIYQLIKKNTNYQIVSSICEYIFKRLSSSIRSKEEDNLKESLFNFNFQVSSLENNLYLTKNILVSLVNLTENMYSDDIKEDIRVLLMSFSLENISLILQSVLLEKKIIVIGDSIDMTTKLINSILYLIFPFKWKNILVSYLNLNYIKLLDSPFPYILGCDEHTLNKYCRKSTYDKNQSNTRQSLYSQAFPKDEVLVINIGEGILTLVNYSIEDLDYKQMSERMIKDFHETVSSKDEINFKINIEKYKETSKFPEIFNELIKETDENKESKENHIKDKRVVGIFVKIVLKIMINLTNLNDIVKKNKYDVLKVLGSNEISYLVCKEREKLRFFNKFKDTLYFHSMDSIIQSLEISSIERIVLFIKNGLKFNLEDSEEGVKIYNHTFQFRYKEEENKQNKKEKSDFSEDEFLGKIENHSSEVNVCQVFEVDKFPNNENKELYKILDFKEYIKKSYASIYYSWLTITSELLYFNQVSLEFNIDKRTFNEFSFNLTNKLLEVIELIRKKKLPIPNNLLDKVYNGANTIYNNEKIPKLKKRVYGNDRENLIVEHHILDKESINQIVEYVKKIDKMIFNSNTSDNKAIDINNYQDLIDYYYINPCMSCSNLKKRVIKKSFSVALISWFINLEKPICIDCGNIINFNIYYIYNKDKGKDLTDSLENQIFHSKLISPIELYSSLNKTKSSFTYLINQHDNHFHLPIGKYINNGVSFLNIVYFYFLLESLPIPTFFLSQFNNKKPLIMDIKYASLNTFSSSKEFHIHFGLVKQNFDLKIKIDSYIVWRLMEKMYIINNKEKEYHQTSTNIDSNHQQKFSLKEIKKIKSYIKKYFK